MRDYISSSVTNPRIFCAEEKRAADNCANLGLKFVINIYWQTTHFWGSIARHWLQLWSDWLHAYKRLLRVSTPFVTAQRRTISPSFVNSFIRRKTYRYTAQYSGFLTCPLTDKWRDLPLRPALIIEVSLVLLRCFLFFFFNIRFKSFTWIIRHMRRCVRNHDSTEKLKSARIRLKRSFNDY